MLHSYSLLYCSCVPPCVLKAIRATLQISPSGAWILSFANSNPPYAEQVKGHRGQVLVRMLSHRILIHYWQGSN